MMARLAAILASCAFDPNHPIAPCNDTPGPPLFQQPLLWILILLAAVAAIWLVRRRSRPG